MSALRVRLLPNPSLSLSHTLSSPTFQGQAASSSAGTRFCLGLSQPAALGNAARQARLSMSHMQLHVTTNGLADAVITGSTAAGAVPQNGTFHLWWGGGRERLREAPGWHKGCQPRPASRATSKPHGEGVGGCILYDQERQSMTSMTSMTESPNGVAFRATRSPGCQPPSSVWGQHLEACSRGPCLPCRETPNERSRFKRVKVGC